MTLKEYLQENNLSQHKFLADLKSLTGEEIKQATLARYVLGQRIPKKSQMRLIYKATDGSVSPNDFYLVD